MFLHDVLSSGAMPTLEAALRFASQRQAILAHNIANISTPDFRPADVSVDGFRKTLARAVDERREKSGGESGELEWRRTRELAPGPRGSLTLTPRTNRGGVLFHDRNNRDLERMMQDLAENAGAFRLAADMLRSRHELIRGAIGERT